MSSFTFADNKLGGRLTAASDAIGAGHLNRAAGILAELADELNQEATMAAMADEGDMIAQPVAPPAPPVKGQPADLQMCARNVHAYAAPDSNGWRTCQVCGNVNVAPPDGNGPVDMGATR